jgi:hypothetical protein
MNWLGKPTSRRRGLGHVLTVAEHTDFDAATRGLTPAQITYALRYGHVVPHGIAAAPDPPSKATRSGDALDEMLAGWKQLVEMLAEDKSEADARHAPRVKVPAFCECLLCLLVDPEFQEDRLADFKERFNNTWVPRFGHRAAGFVYVWHVLRQSGFVDWLVRTFLVGRSE